MRQASVHFWRSKRVLLTGHTGFKGAWLALLLERLGAEVTGFALAPEAGPSAFVALRPAITSRIGNLRDAAAVQAAVQAARPKIVLHLAAQALVGRGYRDPEGTFASNLTGTINLMQALRGAGAKAALIITSDKVYRNNNQGRAFREDDPLGGHDPYSASKAACEIAVASWRASFGAEIGGMATARAGNVIGGGDFGAERLIPDLVRARIAGETLVIRRPDATRPFQHVLDVLRGYLLHAEALWEGSAPQALNFGPRDTEISVRRVLELYGAAAGAPIAWEAAPAPPMEEAQRLALDSGLAMQSLGWAPRHDAASAIAATARWYEAWRGGADGRALALAEIEEAVSP
ncbi:MAG: CDP-glucose 4,6-dehydratase [Alphaproteobacteria bacterium]|nr:CDP-glucose 4,6-dehydratase [Alphaproteobacteria bacterium]